MNTERPILFVDVDGVISTYGFDHQERVPGQFHMVDGILHHIAPGMDKRLTRLAGYFELLWATGWGERANEHLVGILDLPGELEVVEFAVRPSADGSGHWKLAALTERLDNDSLDRRPAAWVDDGHNEACEAWAASRSAPTLLVTTEPAVGLTDAHVETLMEWAMKLAG